MKHLTNTVSVADMP